MVAGEIAHDSLLQNMPIGVADYMRAITLSGAVYTPQQKAHATEVSRSVNGVKKVNN
jgi:osmotically-inducible protein OsmY